MNPRPEEIVVHDNLFLGTLMHWIQQLDWNFVTIEFRLCLKKKNDHYRTFIINNLFWIHE